MKKLSILLQKIDNNILHWFLILFVFFIPLYPKIPLHIVNYTYIAIRLDDIFIATLIAVYIIQLLRRKVKLPERFTWLFALYWLFVFLSLFSGIFFTETVDYPKVGFLHALRRIEYMSIFLITASTITSIKQAKHYFLALFSSFSLVGIYGLGQRIFQFPAVSTMNPEFARGHILFLQPEARVASTFAGHYDLAAYLVFLVPILWGTLIALTPTQKHIFFEYISTLVSFVRIPLTGIYTFVGKFFFKTHKQINTLRKDISLSRLSLDNESAIAITITAITSIIILVIALSTSQILIMTVLITTLIITLLMLRYTPRFAIVYLLGLSLIILVQTASRSSFIAYLVATSLMLLLLRKFKYLALMIVFSLALTYTNTNLSQRFSETFQVKKFLVNEFTGDIFVLQKISSDKLPAGSQLVMKLDNKEEAKTDEEQMAQDQFYHSATAGAELSPDEIASFSASYKEISGIATDISFATRLQIEWPRAIEAFLKNPILGSGPSSITESTDNDYLRWLGEFGLLGTATFLYIIILLMYLAYSQAQILTNHAYPLFIGIVFGTIGLLINATYIDVFEASKVAYTFWFVWGAFYGLMLSKK